jgi:hypothetical protein
MNNSTCNSSGIVYIIKCKRCSVFYIGKSKRKAKKSNYEQLNSIKRFGKDVIRSVSKLNEQSETAIHFNTKDHNLQRDLEFYIFKTNLDDSCRLSVETDLINILLRKRIPIINQKLRNQYKINHLTFLDTCK